MVNGLYTARNGMMLLQEMVDNTSHNLANVNTTAFKKSLMASMTRVDVGRNDEAKLHQDEDHRMAENFIVWEQGSFVDTDNDFDLAIEGDGFFQVQTPDGIRFTRSGSLTRNGMGELVTLQGFQVLDIGGAPLRIEGGRFSVSAAGQISVDGQPAGEIAVVDFEDRRALRRQGNNLYSLREQETEIEPRQVLSPTIRQGSLETSNVNAVESMVELIRFQRNYEVDQKAVHALDETLSKAVNEIGRVG